MVSGKVKSVMGFQRSSSPATPKADTPRRSSSSPANSSNAGKSGGGSSFARSFGVYFPKSSAQVQPKPPDVAELIKVIEELQERESRLRTHLLEQKILRETVKIVPFLEAELEKSKESVRMLEMENVVLKEEIEVLRVKEKSFIEMQREVEELRKKISEKKNDPDECSSSSSSSLDSSGRFQDGNASKTDGENEIKDKLEKKSTNQQAESSAGSNIPKPPPLPTYAFPRSYRPSSSFTSSSSSSSSTSSSTTSPSQSSTTTTKPMPKLTSLPPIPPPLPDQPSRTSSSSTGAPPPPPLPSKTNIKSGIQRRACVQREPEVVEFYHSLMRRDSKRESSGGASGDTAAICPRDMIGEIENRSAYLLAIKSDVETQGDFIKFLIKEVQNANFTKIDEVVTFVKWLDDELSCLVDERAVLKHFNWPEQKADALREAAFGFSDLKKLETEASSFKDDSRQPCSIALKKMQTHFEKLEHGVYGVARMRDGAMSRYKGFGIPVDWMQDSGIASQIKLASVKLAKLYMKRVSSELEALNGGPDEEELMLQAVRFAFRVHQFAGGFDVETMRAFQELKEKVSLFHIQSQNQRLVGKSN